MMQKAPLFASLPKIERSDGLKCPPKVRQKTFGVYYVKKEETWLCRVLEVHAHD